jgi:Fuc2NAc and GlcNAc transferase
MNSFPGLLWILITCFVGTILLIWAYKRLAIKMMVIDIPNHRSAHAEPTPTGVGIVVALVFSLGVIALLYGEMIEVEVLIILIAPVVITLVGFIDDVNHVGWRVRATLHFMAASWCIYLFGFPVLGLFGVQLDLGLAGVVLGALSLVWLLNLYNFMDGIDGLAATEILFVVVAALLICQLGGGQSGDGQPGDRWFHPLLLLIVVTAAFLIFNWPKAAVFMGDAGSGFLGLLLGILILDSDIVSLWTWLILSTYFLTDACLTITVRLVRGEKIWLAHSEHAYQHLSRRIGADRTLYAIVLVNVIWLMPIASLSEAFSEYGILLLSLACIPLLVVEYLLGAGQATSGPGRVQIDE